MLYVPSLHCAVAPAGTTGEPNGRHTAFPSTFSYVPFGQVVEMMPDCGWPGAASEPPVPSSHSATPPWPEHVPECVWERLGVPSLHRAVTTWSPHAGGAATQDASSTAKIAHHRLNGPPLRRCARHHTDDTRQRFLIGSAAESWRWASSPG